MSVYPNGFGASGVSIQGLPVLNTYSNKVFWVGKATNGSAGSDGNEGSFERPFATIDYAIGKCTADRGDIIFVKAGHTETVDSAADINADVAGISIIGLGVGKNKPTITFSTLTTATFAIGANNVLIRGLRFVAGVNALATPIDVNNTAIIQDCEFSATGVYQPLTWVDIAGNAGSCTDTQIEGCKFTGHVSSAGTACISLLEVHDNVGVKNCNFFGNYSSGCIIGIAGKIATKVAIEKNTFFNYGAGGLAVMASCTGIFANNGGYAVGGATLGYNGASMAYHENYLSSALAVSTLLAKNGAFA